MQYSFFTKGPQVLVVLAIGVLLAGTVTRSISRVDEESIR